MPARKLDGVRVGGDIRAELLPRVASFAATHGRPPSLHIVLVGENPASQVYVRNKERAGVETGLDVVVHRLSATASADEVLGLVHQLNADAACDGILVQAPLPAALGKRAEQQVFDAIDPAKDVDGFHPHNVGLLVQGRAALTPCTPSGVIELLMREQLPIAGRHAVVIGRSEIVGKPMALLLLQRDATVTICHSKTANLAAMAATADIVVAAIGRPAFVTQDFVKPGAIVIDVGIHPIENPAPGGPKYEGDVDFEAVRRVASAITPVPGGVGPLTVAMLLSNLADAAERAAEAPARR